MGVEPHAGAGDGADHDAVEETQQRLLRHRGHHAVGAQFAQGDAAQGHGQRLATGVARLAGQHRQEHRQHHDLLQRALEQADHGGGEERGEQVEDQPRQARLEAARPRRGEALFLLDADHGAGLGGDLEGLLLEHHLALDHAQQVAVGVAHRIDRVVARDHLAHGVGQVGVRAQVERVAQHHVAQQLFAPGEQQLAEGDHADQRARGIGDEDVGHHALLDDLAQRVGDFADAGAGPEHRRRALHEPAHGAFRIAVALEPELARADQRRGGDAVAALGREFLQHLDRLAGIEPAEQLGDGVVAMLGEPLRGGPGVEIADEI